MPKTYYIGRTKADAIVARASGNDYGYTHAAVIGPKAFQAGQVVPLSAASFSTSAGGALRNASRCSNGEVEVVAVEKVDRARYVSLTGKS